MRVVMFATLCVMSKCREGWREMRGGGAVVLVHALHLRQRGRRRAAAVAWHEQAEKRLWLSDGGCRCCDWAPLERDARARPWAGAKGNWLLGLLRGRRCTPQAQQHPLDHERQS